MSDGSPSGRITAHAAPVRVQRVEGDHFSAEERRRIDLARDIDVVLMRQDPPFDLLVFRTLFMIRIVLDL